ncbi:substrate-binding domain-containing protein (plasmid) [Levilactobacillus brevis]|uniref:Substrate-binding domain-containing protein n=1 Tax=Levilactobacillus brevis TaxID=1580 RepID=A0AB38X8G2_LEVBR|nr:substrate-binding domain-containing protein [Levilactobacillus brevis]WAD02918.1 substrate-binding domain-containing protein [Levilactobacillus brevis]WAE46287.1 substrate-binding domain-containing protein [Levilactobacillus brevis]
MEKLTMMDIAKLADVSIATVSNYINGKDKKMSKKTKTKLARIIKDNDFIPNSTARDLAKNENNTIGVSIADITNPFTTPVISGIYDACYSAGYRVVITNADNDENREIQNIKNLKQDNMSGIIVDPVNADGKIYDELSNKNTVLVDRQAKQTKIDTVVTDNFEAVRLMTQAMLENKYTEMYFVTWPLNHVSTRMNRYNGFKSAIEDIKPELKDNIITVPHHGKQQDYDKFNQTIFSIMDRKYLGKIGFFTMNARVLLRLLRVMNNLGYHYPEDYGLATYEEFDWMLVMNPGISCIRQDSFQIGVQAMEILRHKILKQNEKDIDIPSIKIVSTQQIYRASF